MPFQFIHETFAEFPFMAFRGNAKKALGCLKFMKDIFSMKRIDIKCGIMAVRRIKTVKRKMLLYADAKCN